MESYRELSKVNKKLLSITDRVTNPEAVKLGLSQPAPNVRLVDLVCEVQATVNRDNVFHKHVNGVYVLLVFLINREGFLIEAMISGNSGDFSFVVVLQFVDITHDLPLIGTDSSEQQQVLKIPVVAEWSGF